MEKKRKESKGKEWKRKERKGKDDFHEIFKSTQIKTAETESQI